MFDKAYVRKEILVALMGAGLTEFEFFPATTEEGDTFLVAAGLEPNERKVFLIRVEEYERSEEEEN